MTARQYQKELDALIGGLTGTPTLLLHACCAPCSSYVLEYLARYFDITLFFYNPNITLKEEYVRRLGEVERLLAQMPLPRPVGLIRGEYDPERFLTLASGLEREPEGGARCGGCYGLRLEEAARLAAREGFEYFTSTLSISPYKNAQTLNQIGEQAAAAYGVRHLPCDFKKRGGYRRSVELSAQYGLYRQNYCGCVFSKQASERARMQAAQPFG